MHMGVNRLIRCCRFGKESFLGGGVSVKHPWRWRNGGGGVGESGWLVVPTLEIGGHMQRLSAV